MIADLWVRVSQLVIAICLLIIVIVEYLRPWVAVSLYEEDFKRLSLECDQAMHNEVALRDTYQRSDLPEALVVSGAVELAICHQYDKLRKRMLILGVGDERLALLSLEALETERIPLSLLVEPHQMQRF